MDWLLKARQYVDDFTDSIVEQANVAQEQIAGEQTKVRDEVAKQKQNFKGESQLPWETSDDSLAILSQDVMEQILSLSLTEQNFNIAPPQLEVMTFVFTEHIPTAMRLLVLDANLAKMHAKLSPKMDEEVFWHHYFFRVKYIRLIKGLEKVGTDTTSSVMKALNEDLVLYKPTFEPEVKIRVAPVKASAMQRPCTVAPPTDSTDVDRSDSGNKEKDEKKDTADGANEDLEAKKIQLSMETRRLAEAALAAEVEAELDDDDIDLADLGDLDLGDDVDDFDDLGDLDDDDELEAQISRELANESNSEKDSPLVE